MNTVLHDDFPFGLLYNHTLRIDPPKPLDDTQSVRPFDFDTDTLVLSGLYQEKTGYLCRITHEVHSNTSEYHHGFRFYGDNWVIYRKTGSTTFDGSPGMNDIIGVVEEISK